MHFSLYRDRKKEWRWRLVARNGRVIADSAEGYKRPGACRHQAELIRSHVQDATIEVPVRALSGRVRRKAMSPK